jgi:hypothetical protein
MNYPTQGDPYGQRPLGGDPYGQQQQQQPGYGQQVPSGFGQPGPGWPAGYGAGQGYAPRLGQQFGTAPGGFGQASGDGPPPPRKSPLPLIPGIAGVVVVIVLAIGAFVVFNSGADNDPHQVAQTVVDEMNKLENANTGTIVYCDAQKDTARRQFDNFINGFKEVKKQAGDQYSAKFTVADVKTEGGQGSFGIIVETSFQGKPTTATVPAQLVLEDGSWKVCGLQS